MTFQKIHFMLAKHHFTQRRNCGGIRLKFDEIIAAASRKAQTVVTASSSALPTRKVHADILSET